MARDCRSPAGKRLHFRNEVPHQWISISVARDLLPQQAIDRIDEQIDLGEATILDAEKERFVELARVADDIARPKQQTAGATPADPSTYDNTRLIDALAALVAGSEPAQSGRGKQDGGHYRQVVRHALSDIPDRGRVDVDDLRRASGADGRTLRRAFNNVFRMPPVRYLKLRQLNQVHVALRTVEARGQLVTDILTRHGVTELGRFAAEYRALFGEPPSQTIRRSALRQAGPTRA